ncbi:aminotransferase class I/II-fold pyridoxal phosphate-dependent enzyme [Vibrio sp. 10N.237.312.B06]|uniref:aminotransferase class I/II-fold pyridoxal phosphate-dependent enzyme n=1 Tax=Vibrio sp. 10N.237.312.B06 TaxID=3229974 RepID=UPI0035527FB4
MLNNLMNKIKNLGVCEYGGSIHVANTHSMEVNYSKFGSEFQLLNELIFFIIGEYFDNNYSLVAKYLGYSQKEIEIIFAMDEDIDKNFVARPDVVFDGIDPKILELNIGAAIGGMFFSSLSRLIDHDDCEYDTLRLWAKYIISRYPSSSTLHIIEDDKYFERMKSSLDVLAAELQNFNSSSVKVIRSSQVELVNGSYVGDGKEITNILPMFSLNDILLDENKYRAILDGCSSRQVNVIGGPKYGLIANKMWFAKFYELKSELPKHFSQFIEKYIPKTFVLESDVAKHVRQHKNDYVIKPGSGYGGKDVIIGKSTPPDCWRKYINKFVNSKYIVQQYIPPSFHETVTLNTNGRYEVIEAFPLYGFFLIDGKYSGVSIRALPKSSGDVVISMKNGAVNGPSSIKMSKLPKPRAIALKKLPQITHSKNVRTLVNNEPPYGSYLKLYPETDYSVLTSEYARFQNFITTNASQTDLHKENILLTAGAVDAFRLILDTFLEPAIDSVCIPIPTFFGLIHWSEVHGLNVVKTTLEKPHYNELNLDVILNSKTKAIVLCDPNNPIGTRLSHQQIKLLAHCYHGLVIIDEAYIEMSEAESNVALLKDLKNVMLIRTFSKALGLAGLRVGAILSNEENVRHLKSMQEPFILSTPVIQALKQELAVNTQRDDIQLFKERRAELIMILKTFKGIKRVYDSHTTFITIELFELESIVSALEKHDISVVIEPSGLKNTIRISLSNYDIVNKVVGILKNLNRIVEGLL